MKTPLRRLLAVSTVLSLTVLTVDAAPKIGVLLKGKSAFWSAAEKGALAAGEKNGVEVVVKAPPTETDVALQIQLLNVLVAQGVQAIVIAPCSKDALKEPTEAAAAKGIKIVVIDSALSGTASSNFVGTSQHAAGEAAGKLLTGLVAETDEITLLKHNQSSEATEQRERGALEKLREVYPKAVVHGDIYVASEKGVEDERAALVFTKYPKTKAVLATSTQGTMAMLKLLETRNLGGKIKFIGFGFNLNPTVAEAIDNGAMDVWIAQQPGEVAAAGVRCAAALLKGETAPAVTNIDIAVITKANLKDPKIQALMVD
jgi:ribose transport system substrate-binding protein